MFNDDVVRDLEDDDELEVVDTNTVVTSADGIPSGIAPPEHEGDVDLDGDANWLTTGEHPGHPEVAGQPDPRG